MTKKDFAKLPYGTIVRWREQPSSPRAGELTDRGSVSRQFGVKAVLWEDGQVTDGKDDWALESIEGLRRNHSLARYGMVTRAVRGN